MLIVRNAQESDIQSLVKLEKATFSDAWTEKSIYDTFCQKQAFILVAESEDEVVGYCVVYFVLDEGEIARIAVDQSMRRRGIGREILNGTENICTEKGITRLLLDVRESNMTAREFYKRMGFQEDGIRKNFYDMPREHAVLMSKSVQ